MKPVNSCYFSNCMLSSTEAPQPIGAFAQRHRADSMRVPPPVIHAASFEGRKRVESDENCKTDTRPSVMAMVVL